ncbi:MAG: 16S rRNA (guanine(527)-N(7))-methyltransferase RsmG [Rhodocyclaceae bacterium]|nr:MAG: 16S rRNA (guanine(527)-N(7))-methyltransferase RsmG [Rhodocyclaceae bacterium]
MNQTVLEQIHGGIRRLGLDLSAASEETLGTYLSLLAKWNRTYNLTAVREESAMVSQHLLDSLAVLPYLQSNSSAAQSLADVGSGGGLPGIPLAIAYPQIRVELIEASHKKASFLEQVRIELKLQNVSVHCGRVEAYKPMYRFDVLISRAFSSLADFVQLAAHLLVPGGRLLAMKGVHPQEEIEHLPPGWCVSQSIPLNVPELNAQRGLIVIERA